MGSFFEQLLTIIKSNAIPVISIKKINSNILSITYLLLYHQIDQVLPDLVGALVCSFVLSWCYGVWVLWCYGVIGLGGCL
jgi:hypothetical protein